MYIVNDNVFFSNKCYKISDLRGVDTNVDLEISTTPARLSE
jgi:hypothetical protein